MKHVKSYEKRTYNIFYKYLPILKEKFDADNIIMFSEDGKIHLFIEHALGISTTKHILENMLEKLRPYDYIVKVNRNQVVLRFVIDVTDEFMEQLNIELDSNKYNL